MPPTHRSATVNKSLFTLARPACLLSISMAKSNGARVLAPALVLKAGAVLPVRFFTKTRLSSRIGGEPGARRFQERQRRTSWKQEADGLVGTWGTLVLVEVDKSRTDLVIGVPYEIWGLNPETGKLRWFCNATEDESYCSSVVAGGDVVYAIDGRSGGSYAVKAGGKDDVSKSHLVWSGSGRNGIGSPVVADGKIYFISRKVINCVDCATGKEIFQARLDSKAGGEQAQPPAGGPGGGAADLVVALEVAVDAVVVAVEWADKIIHRPLSAMASCTTSLATARSSSSSSVRSSLNCPPIV